MITVVLDVLAIAMLIVRSMKLLALATSSDPRLIMTEVAKLPHEQGGHRLTNLCAALLNWYLLARFVGWWK